ncbi:MAG: hypothetical protein CFE44_25425, partial [Burkholderiales bacterium PBB4]
SKAIPGRIVDVLAVRADALELHADALRALVAAYFQARSYWEAQPIQASAKMAPRLQTPAHEVAAMFQGLHVPDLPTNRRMLAPDGAFHRTSQELQRVMVEAGLLRKISHAKEIADLRLLPK